MAEYWRQTGVHRIENDRCSAFGHIIEPGFGSLETRDLRKGAVVRHASNAPAEPFFLLVCQAPGQCIQHPGPYESHANHSGRSSAFISFNPMQSARLVTSCKPLSTRLMHCRAK